VRKCVVKRYEPLTDPRPTVRHMPAVYNVSPLSSVHPQWGSVVVWYGGGGVVCMRVSLPKWGRWGGAWAGAMQQK